MWRVDQQLTTVGASLARSDERMLTGRNAAGRVWKTGFGGLDPLIGGGMRAGSLILLAGPQGLGKSTFALQVARNNAATGRPVLYFSYEHDAEDMTQKLIAIEAGELDESDQVRMNSIRSVFDDLWVQLARPPAGVGALRCRGAGQGVALLRDALRPPLDRHPHRPGRHPGRHRGGPRAGRHHAAGGRGLPAEGEVHLPRRGRALDRGRRGPQGPRHRHQRPGAGHRRRREGGAAPGTPDARQRPPRLQRAWPTRPTW